MKITIPRRSLWSGLPAIKVEIDASYERSSAGVQMGAAVKVALASGADLRSADLSGAKGFVPDATVDLLMLLDQPGKIRAYKMVTDDGHSPMHGALFYAIGKRVSVDDAATDPCVECDAGINVATLPWCLANWQSGRRVLIVEFTAADIAAIPHGTDGKFCLHRCKVVGEKDIAPILAAMGRK